MVDEFRKREETNHQETANISKEEEEIVDEEEEEPLSLSISSPSPPTIDTSSSLTTISSPCSSMNQKIDKEEEIDQKSVKEIDQKQQNQPNEKDIILDKKEDEIEVGIGIVTTRSQDDEEHMKKEDG